MQLFIIIFTAILFLSPAVQAQDVFIQGGGSTIQMDENGLKIITPDATIVAPDNAAAPQKAAPKNVYQPNPEARSYSNASLAGADFSGKNLQGASFVNTDLKNAKFVGSNLQGATFVNVELDGAQFCNANLSGASFSNTELNGANLSNVLLVDTSFVNSDAEQAYVGGTDLTAARFTNSDWANAYRTSKPCSGASQSEAPAQPRPSFVSKNTIETALQKPRIENGKKMPAQIDLTINFDSGSDKLTDAGSRQVAELAQALQTKTLQGNRILLEGHTDDVGTDAYNEDLSYARATRVMRTLVDKHSVNATDLSVKGYGEKNPVASNADDLGRAQNRRVTVVNLTTGQ